MRTLTLTCSFIKLILLSVPPATTSYKNNPTALKFIASTYYLLLITVNDS